MSKSHSSLSGWTFEVEEKNCTIPFFFLWLRSIDVYVCVRDERIRWRRRRREKKRKKNENESNNKAIVLLMRTTELPFLFIAFFFIIHSITFACEFVERIITTPFLIESIIAYRRLSFFLLFIYIERSTWAFKLR